MMRNLRKKPLLVALGALSLAVSAQAELFDRGSGMIYDSRSNLTWLIDANAAPTLGAHPDGLMSWSQAVSWADQLVFGGFSDWRLPQVRPVNGVGLNLDYSEDGSTDGGINQRGLNSELGFLFYVSLGNQANSSELLAGPFQRLQNYAYWTGTSSPYAGEAMHFFTAFGDQGSSPTESLYYAWAVREGDVLAVPEPQSAALMLLGLAVLCGRRFAARRASA
jgi:hypothetical protein